MHTDNRKKGWWRHAKLRVCVSNFDSPVWSSAHLWVETCSLEVVRKKLLPAMAASYAEVCDCPKGITLKLSNFYVIFHTLWLLMPLRGLHLDLKSTTSVTINLIGPENYSLIMSIFFDCFYLPHFLCLPLVVRLNEIRSVTIRLSDRLYPLLWESSHIKFV